MLKKLLFSIIPWVIFFICFSYDELRVEIGACGALVALVLLDKQGLRRGFIFDWGSLIFFIFLFATVIVYYQPWVVDNALMFANVMLTLMAWVSLAFGKPFTMQYVSMVVAQEYGRTALFTSMNRWLTAVWATVFTIMTALEIMERVFSAAPVWVSETSSLVLLVAAIWITTWFPNWYKSRKIGTGGLLNLQGLSDLHVASMKSADISYRIIGHGPVILLLPTAQMTMYAWDVEFIEQLAKSFQVILPDYPGVNASVLKEGEFSVLGLANIFAEFISILHLKAITVLGYSMGGWIAQRLVLDHGQQIDSLVLIATDAGGVRATSTAANVVEKLAQPMSKSARQLFLSQTVFSAAELNKIIPKLKALRASAGDLLDVLPAVLQQQYQLAQEWFAGQGTYQQLSRIHQPTIVITGILDKVVHRQNSLVLANGIAGAVRLEYPNAGHGIIYEYPVELAKTIAEKIKQLT